MNIRFATITDILNCIELGRYLHQKTRFSVYQFQKELVEKNLLGLIEIGQNKQKTHCFLLAENTNNVLVGALIACIDKHIFSNQPVANVISFGVLPQARMTGAAIRLLKAFHAWSEKRGVFELNVGINSGVHIEKSDRLMKKLGFTGTGGNYALSINTQAE
jgi:N-acetylglutamate synthase-like GNAT family acetyltransferase